MKIRTLNNDSLIKEIRYNEKLKTTTKPIIKEDNEGNPDKRNYAAISLLTIIKSAINVEPKKIKESFNKANEYINIYEGKGK